MIQQIFSPILGGGYLRAPYLTKFRKVIGPSSMLKQFVFFRVAPFWNDMRLDSKATGVENLRQITHFLPHVKVRGGMNETCACHVFFTRNYDPPK